MKRIDEKIKEIEKKDRTSRWLYYVIIAGIIGFLFYASTTRKKIIAKDVVIDSLTITNSAIYKQLAIEKDNTVKLYNDLKNSLEPKEYWEHIRDENTVEGYIGFITNDWGIDKTDFLPKAYERLMDNNASTAADGYDGWLFVGRKNNADEYTSGNSQGEKVIKIIYRKGDDENIAHTEPEVGDIVQLVRKRNRVTYSRKDKVGKNAYRNEQGFRNKTKAIVVDRHPDPNSAEYFVKLKYY